MILVLIVREVGLRSTLAARLSMAGVDVVTADSFDDPRVRRLRGRAVLVLDDPALVREAGDLAALIADPRWEVLVLVGDEAHADGEENPRLLRVARASAGAAIEAQLPGWRKGKG